MRQMMQLMIYALLATFAQNMIFTAGIGADRAIRAAAKPKQILPSAGLVAIFSLVGLLGSVVSRRLLQAIPALETVRMLPPILFLAAAYLLILLFANLVHKPLFIYLKEILSGCAFNSIVMLLGTAGSVYTVSFSKMIGFSIGTGVGFLLATLLIAEGIRRIGNPDMDRCFLGLPSLLIYIGILAMAFVGFTGGAGITM
ncbi:MAG: Rnf-Nqr domain containing protein [Acutalibacteraceae bacterium]|jgi:electron transport complex protein RnfA